MRNEHDILVAASGGIDACVYTRPEDRWHSSQAAEPPTWVKTTVTFCGWLLARGRQHLSVYDLASGDAPRARVFSEFQHCVMAQTHWTAHPDDSVLTINGRMVAIQLDGLSMRPCLKSEKAEGVRPRHSPAGRPISRCHWPLRRVEDGLFP